ASGHQPARVCAISSHSSRGAPFLPWQLTNRGGFESDPRHTAEPNRWRVTLKGVWTHLLGRSDLRVYRPFGRIGGVSKHFKICNRSHSGHSSTSAFSSHLAYA